VVFGAGPTVGDIGACGRTATALDVATFSAQRKAVDCHRCTACGVMTQTCARACNTGVPSDVFIPSTCFPLAHDGEVCLDALEAASCSAYVGFVSDTAPTAPAECEFCRDVPDGGP
jgi:hypothetical protein